jgi:hypothetical protein
VTLKRQQDRRDFSMTLERLSSDDQRFIDEIRTEIKQIIDDSNGGESSIKRFVGFTDPSEETWEVARRLGTERDLWACPTQALWFYTGSRSLDRVVRVKTQRIERVSDSEYFVHGEWISLRLRSSTGKLSLGGDRLMATLYDDSKITVAEKGVEYSPRMAKENLISIKTEKVGVTERLVITIDYYDGR